MYQIYNPICDVYDLYFEEALEAKIWARTHSQRCCTKLWVVDTATGEIIAMYDHGQVTWEAA